MWTFSQSWGGSSVPKEPPLDTGLLCSACNREPKMSSETEFSSSQLNASLFEKTFVIITDFIKLEKCPLLRLSLGT
jgi:hypothetical protein